MPVGSIAVALVYPALKARYGIGGQGLTSPISVKWAGFAELLNQGFNQLPRGCFDAMLIAVALGIVITCLEPRYSRFLPSPTAVGIGMLIPGQAILPMVAGGLASMGVVQGQPEDRGEVLPATLLRIHRGRSAGGAGFRHSGDALTLTPTSSRRLL